MQYFPKHVSVGMHGRDGPAMSSAARCPVLVTLVKPAWAKSMSMRWGIEVRLVAKIRSGATQIFRIALDVQADYLPRRPMIPGGRNASCGWTSRWIGSLPRIGRPQSPESDSTDRSTTPFPPTRPITVARSA